MQTRPALHGFAPNTADRPPIYFRSPPGVAFIRRGPDNSVCTFRFPTFNGTFQPARPGSARPAAIGRPAEERSALRGGRRVAAETVDHDVLAAHTAAGAGRRHQGPRGLARSKCLGAG